MVKLQNLIGFQSIKLVKIKFVCLYFHSHFRVIEQRWRYGFSAVCFASNLIYQRVMTLTGYKYCFYNQHRLGDHEINCSSFGG